jgi:hypothetical protein
MMCGQDEKRKQRWRDIDGKGKIRVVLGIR